MPRPRPGQLVRFARVQGRAEGLSSVLVALGSGAAARSFAMGGKPGGGIRVPLADCFTDVGVWGHSSCPFWSTGVLLLGGYASWPRPVGGTSSASRARTAPVDLVAYGADLFDRLACGVVERPIHVALAGVEGAGVPAAHGDHDVGGAGRLVRDGLGTSVDMSMPTSAMAATTAGLSCAGRGRAGGAHGHPPAGVMLQQSGRHLGAPGIVHAHEQDFGGHFHFAPSVER